MRCPKCGTENAAGKIVCQNCGTRLRVAAAAQSTATTTWTEETIVHWARRDLVRVVIAIGVLVVLGAVLGITLR
ncbi:MAG: zinc ribbon domain-containing protein [Armatimonadetes bacterium]|nr:zinc ribbon domain-containing protein [Armatimonadota bacterium]